MIYLTHSSAESSSVAPAKEYLSKYNIMPELEGYLAKQIWIYHDQEREPATMHIMHVSSYFN